MSGTSTCRTILRAVAIAALALTAGGTADADGTGHAHGDARTETPSKLHEGATLIEARRVYLDRCAACHGVRGHGSDQASGDFAAPDALVRLTRDAIAQILERGHGGPQAQSLTESDRTSVTNYIRNYLMLPAPDTDTETGRAIYARSCSVCHGDRGDGASWAQNSLNPAPADFTEHGLLSVTREQMIDAVTFGKDRTAMMPFAVQLGRDEIAATVDYIRAAFMKEGHGMPAGGHDHGGGDSHGDHAPAIMETGFPGGLAGNPTWGRAFYNANCAECHGETGDGEGRRAYFMLIKPENFLGREARAALDRTKLFEKIALGVNGTTMPAWNTVLTAQQIADVGEYVYRAFLHPERFSEGSAQPPGWSPAAADPAGSKKN